MEMLEVTALTSQLRVLYVEDDATLRAETGVLLEEFFKEVLYGADGKEGLEVFLQNREHIDLLITDVNMPRMSGIELIHALKKEAPELPVVIISAHNETELFLDSIQSGVNGYLLKPLRLDQFLHTIGKVAQIVCAMRENAAYKLRLEHIVREKTRALEENYRQLQRALSIDPVTELPNQASLHEELYCMGRDTRLCVMVFDVDNFAGLNTLMGYEKADVLLRKVGNMLSLTLPVGAKLYREASDEFVVLLGEETKEQLESIAQQALSFFKETPVVQHEETDIYISFCIGIAVKERPMSALLKARTALHELKEAGLAGRHQFFLKDSPFSLTQKHNALWVHKARKALEEDRVVPYFQPIVEMKTGLHVRYECLARLRESDGKILMPLYFIEPLRLGGLMGNLTRMLIKKCYEALGNKNSCLSINLSHEDLMDPTFVDFLIKRTALSDINPSSIVLEILEDVAMGKEMQDVHKSLAQLKAHGFKIAIDDFGAQRSNFSRLEEASFDILKIDGQFVRNIDAMPHKQTIVKNIVKMAKGMGLEVIAEHVATQEEKETLEALGVSYGQGFYFSQPLDYLP